MNDNYIKEILKNKGFSLTNVADMLNMGKQNFGQQLERTPSFELIKRISLATGISLDELAGYSHNEHSPNTLTCPKCGAKLNINISEED